LPDYPPTDLGIFAVYAPNRYLAAKTRLLIDLLAFRFGDRPTWDDFQTNRRTDDHVADFVEGELTQER
jgi:hypothetical protein